MYTGKLFLLVSKLNAHYNHMVVPYYKIELLL